jgi:biotin-dependent carboxylase-like uncharacterized protein
MTPAAALHVTRVAGLATVQDLGRPGHMHEGVPPSGALAPELLARANLAAGNAASAAGIEVIGAMTLVAREASVTVATEDGAARVLEVGDSLAVAPAAGARVRYLAVRGGIDVPVVLGSRSTLLVAAFGGFEGRALRRGDALPVGSEASSAALPSALPSAHPPLDFDRPIRVVLGPDLARFAESAPETLLSSAFTLAPSSDRTGANLVGPALARRPNDEPRSSPMVAGAIEVTGRGDAIVLGPDHPTTGGYPILAVVVGADRGLFHARQPGVLVRFSRV